MAQYKEYKAEMARKRRAKMIVLLIVIVVIFLLVIALAYVAGRMLTGQPLFDTKASPNVQTAVSEPGTQQGTGDFSLDFPPVNVERYWNTIAPVAPTTDTTTLATDARMLALPENELGAVDYEYFRSALFIGDSLTQGFGIYPPLQDIATVAGFKGIGPREILANNVAQLQTGESVAAWDYICAQAPMSIYIGMGTNALISLSDNDAFLKYYGDFLDALRVQFPNIPIYVQSITPVTTATATNRPLMSNDRIRLLNNAIAVMTQEKGLYYVNVWEVLADPATGALREDIASSNDGYHMRDKTGYEIWVEYLSRHTAYHPNNLQYYTGAVQAQGTAAA